MWFVENSIGPLPLANVFDDGNGLLKADLGLGRHVAEARKREAGERRSRDDTQELLDRLREKQSTLVSEVIGDLVPLGLLHRVLQNLLRDGIPIRDLTQIIEALGDHAGKTQNPGARFGQA